jgi:hypothetical protein
MFFTSPYKFSGDGWNGGDSMGKYELTTECYEHETKHGFIVYVSGEVSCKCKSIGQDLEVFDILENSIKGKGIKLEKEKS